MTTERQSESARINGAKSHGPKSAEGKKKSSRNSLRHGCTAGHTILLACEDRGDFNRMRKDYDAMYKPVTLEEQNLVDEMFATAWRLRRATTIETALIDLEVVTEEPKLKARFDTVDGGILLASAFRSLADESRSLALVLRYEARLRRIHQQNYDMLLRVRQERQSQPAPPEPPPAPAPTPPPAIPLTEAQVVQADSRLIACTKLRVCKTNRPRSIATVASEAAGSEKCKKSYQLSAISGQRSTEPVWLTADG